MLSNQKSKKKKNSRLSSRRGVSEVISTMMLMGITVTGAIALTYFVNEGFISGNLATASTLDSSSLNLLLLAYDTRDSSNLLGLSEVDNFYDSNLCRSSCVDNSTPILGGTEFIVLQIQNNGLDSIFLEDVVIRGATHSWDPSTSGILLDLLAGQYPADGTFSILSIGTNPNLQNENTEIQNGQIVNILIKFDTANPDIDLGEGIPISLNIGGIHPIQFLIDSGDAR